MYVFLFQDTFKRILLEYTDHTQMILSNFAVQTQARCLYCIIQTLEIFLLVR